MSTPHPDEFCWTFPIFVIAQNYREEVEGEFQFTENTQFVAQAGEDGTTCLAIFTDLDTAERYLAECDPAKGLRAIGFQPAQMLQFLRVVQDDFPKLAVDPSPGWRRIRTAPLQLLVDAIEWHLKETPPSDSAGR